MRFIPIWINIYSVGPIWSYVNRFGPIWSYLELFFLFLFFCPIFLFLLFFLCFQIFRWKKYRHIKVLFFCVKKKLCWKKFCWKIFLLFLGYYFKNSIKEILVKKKCVVKNCLEKKNSGKQDFLVKNITGKKKLWLKKIKFRKKNVGEEKKPVEFFFCEQNSKLSGLVWSVMPTSLELFATGHINIYLVKTDWPCYQVHSLIAWHNRTDLKQCSTTLNICHNLLILN